jgi:hypothetical protein
VTAFTIDQLLTITEALVILLGIAITWAVYYGSDRAELPGEAMEPSPAVADDMDLEIKGRTL